MSAACLLVVLFAAVLRSGNGVGVSITSCAAQNGTVAWSPFAGSGLAGYTGDGGPATNATFTFPRKMSISNVSQPMLYVADSGNGVVRAISTSFPPMVETAVSANAWPLAASNRSLASAFAMDNTSAYWMVLADVQLHVVWGVAPAAAGLRTTIIAGMLGEGGFNGDGTNASACLLSGPTDAIYISSAATYYIADRGNSRVRAVRSHIGGLQLSTVAGSGANLTTSCGDDRPLVTAMIPGVLLHVSDATRSWLVIADQSASCIRALDLTGVNPFLFRIAGGGANSSLWPGVGMPALQYAMGIPTALAYDANASAILVATFDAPFPVAVALTSDLPNATVWSLFPGVVGSSSMCPLRGLAYDNSSGALYASAGCAFGAHLIYRGTCALPGAGADSLATPTPSQTPTPPSIPSTSASSTQTASATPPVAGKISSASLANPNRSLRTSLGDVWPWWLAEPTALLQ